jgi:FemAB-related protein (PEP-CTERM system-associated)
MTTGPDLTVTVALESDRIAWEAYVASRPDASGYHEWAWRTVFARVFGHQCLYLIARKLSSTSSHVETDVVGVLPLVEIRSLLFGRTLTSLPFVNFGGVLADSPEVAQMLVGEAVGLAEKRGCRHVEMRHIDRRFQDLPCKQHKVTMRLPLEPGIWERLDRKARNQVRKAQKSGLTVTRGGVELLGEFYRVFSRNMRDLGTPVYPRRFFEAVLEAFPDRTRLIVVRSGDVPVASGLTYRTGPLIEIPWASSVRSYNTLCPNHLLYWQAIETAAAEGVAVFDFGRSTPNEGTFKFKEQWGARAVALHWEYWLANGGELPDQSPKNPKFRLAIESWKLMPLWLANTIGPRLVRSIP